MKNQFIITLISAFIFAFTSFMMAECRSVKTQVQEYDYFADEFETVDFCYLMCSDNTRYAMSCSSDLMIAEFE